jgi:hypothetical protein
MVSEQTPLNACFPEEKPPGASWLIY